MVQGLAPVWVAPLFGVLAVALVPWIVWLAATLPTRQQAEHYRLAWVGFDLALFAALLAIVVTAVRGSARLERAATVAVVLLLVDVWFDVTTSGRGGVITTALAQAAVLEVPLALVSWWIARHTDEVRRRCAQMRAHAGSVEHSPRSCVIDACDDRGRGGQGAVHWATVGDRDERGAVGVRERPFEAQLSVEPVDQSRRPRGTVGRVGGMHP